MAEKKKWIKGATAGSHGQFRKKAEAAGETTHEYAEEKKDAGGTLGKQANLALNLMGASERRSKMYKHERSRSHRGEK